MAESETRSADPAAPYFEAAARGALALQRCEGCGAYAFPLRARCAACGSSRLGWQESTGRGRVFGHGRLERSSAPELAAALPLTLLLVDLDEGPRIPARLAAGEDPRVRAGDRVAVAFEPAPDGTPLPVFRVERASR